MKGEDAIRVLAVFARADDYETLYWKVDGDDIRLWVNCSDLFFWATADCEEVTPQDIPALEAALGDLLPLRATEYLGDLFSARKRQLRPQKPVYRDMSEEVKALFDACCTAEERAAADKQDAHWWMSVVRKISGGEGQQTP